MLYIGNGETIAATFDNDPEVLEWVGCAAGHDISLSQYLRATYPLAVAPSRDVEHEQRYARRVRDGE